MDAIRIPPDTTLPCVSSRNTGVCTCQISRTSPSEAEALMSNSQDLRQTIRYKDYACARVRLQTFSGWIKRQTPIEMVAAGFFFTNNGDTVRCYVCGIGLQYWDPEDNPFVEHARWSQQCRYIIMVKGEAFVQLIQQAAQEQERDGDISQHTSTNMPEICDSLQALEVDSPFTEVDACSNFTKSECYPDAILRKHPLLTTAAQSVLEMGYLPKYIKIALDRVLETKGWDRLSGENIMEEIFEMEENGEIVSVPTSQNSSSTSSSSEIITEDARKRMEEENQQIQESRLCKICCENSVVIVFLPCSHLVCCGQCSPAMKKCPMCRQPIKGRVRVSW